VVMENGAATTRPLRGQLAKSASQEKSERKWDVA
jgi:hypothetical protein